MPEKEIPNSCKSIFKDGKDTVSKDKLTKVWISLINQLEKSRKNLAEGR